MKVLKVIGTTIGLMQKKIVLIKKKNRKAEKDKHNSRQKIDYLI